MKLSIMRDFAMMTPSIVNLPGTNLLKSNHPAIQMTFYRAFEEIHRGSRALIKTRLRAYAHFIEPLVALHGRPIAIDLGCGRGEWLELLSEAGFEASGVDLDEGMLAACRERSLQVKQAEALSTLRALADDSVTLVSAFHLVEHMPFSDVQLLVAESLRVLVPGGLLIMETPNAENLTVGTYEFYKDPTHARPIPWELLTFLTDFTGFRRNILVRLQESSSLHEAADISLLNVLSGVSPDYAVVAQKNAGDDVLSAFGTAFSTSYGLSLAALAVRYDLQGTSRLAATQEALSRIEASATHHIQQVEQRLIQIESQLQAVFSSRSWRITAPLRGFGNLFRLIIRTANRIIIASKSLIKRLLRHIGQYIQRKPRLKKICLRVLDRMPALRARLQQLVNIAQTAPAGLPIVSTPKNLSPRALQIYKSLQKMLLEKEI